MNLIAWIVVGGIAGWLASIVMKTNASQGLLEDVILGIIGGFVGGVIMNAVVNQPGVTGFNLYSILVSALGAVVVIAIGRALTRA